MSSEDLLTKFNDLVARFSKEFNSLIEEERAKLKAEVEAYKAELQRMNAVQVNDDDLIDLNVGGQRLTTTRSTLCQVEGSLLASMFSGRWEDRLKRDKDGAVFFDFNPQYFILILDYLRARKIASADQPAPFPTVPEDQLETFTSLVEYLGLNDEIVSTQQVLPGEKFNLHSTDVALQDNGKVAVHDGTREHGYALGENVYSEGIANLKLKLESFKDNQWMFVGIVKDTFEAVASVAKNDLSSRWSGSYGWVLGSCGGRVCKNGLWTRTKDNTSTTVSKEGDMVKLIMECEAGKLSLHLPIGQELHIEIPKSESWRLHVTLFHLNEKVRIIER